MAELSAVVGEQHRADLSKREAVIAETCFQFSDFSSGFRCSLVVQKDAKHKVGMSEMERHDDLPTGSANQGAHFSTGYPWMFLHEEEIILVSTVDANGFWRIVVFFFAS